MNPLNTLINKSGANSTSNVSVSKLKEKYKPTSHAQMLALINQHGKKNLQQIAEFAYSVQSKYINQHFTVEQIYAYCYDLFVVKSMNGLAKEQTAMNYLSSVFENIKFKTDSRIDCLYSVDIVAGIAGKFFAGVQVKPESYKSINSTEKRANNEKNGLFSEKFSAPVLYLYYDTNTGRFTNMKEIVESLAQYN